MKTILVPFLGFFLMSAVPAFADTTYTYTGNPFDSFSGNYSCGSECAVSGSFTVANPLASNLPSTVLGGENSILATGFPVSASQVESFSFTDGNTTFDQNNSYFPNSAILIGTDSNGMINDWTVFLQFGPYTNYLYTTNTPGRDISSNQVGYYPYTTLGTAFNNDNPGTWSVTDTPEPSSLLMLSSGLIGLGFIRRRIA